MREHTSMTSKAMFSPSRSQSVACKWLTWFCFNMTNKTNNERNGLDLKQNAFRKWGDWNRLVEKHFVGQLWLHRNHLRCRRQIQPQNQLLTPVPVSAWLSCDGSRSTQSWLGSSKPLALMAVRPSWSEKEGLISAPRSWGCQQFPSCPHSRMKRLNSEVISRTERI